MLNSPPGLHADNRPCLVSPAIPFPAVSWWQKALRTGQVILDPNERYQKMSFRNRYYLAGPQGRQLLSIPLTRGRNQRLLMNEVMSDNASNWKINHWRTLKTLYGRAPFFEYFIDELKPLYFGDHAYVYRWNMESITIINKLLGSPLQLREAVKYEKTYPENYWDLRQCYLPAVSEAKDIVYHQVFEHRSGFLPDCSILDLLFCEGKYSLHLLGTRPG